GKLDDRRSGADFVTTLSVDGARARVYRYHGTNDFTALWVQDRYTIEFRGVAANKDQFAALLGTLHDVDVDTWLSAMPPSVVKPQEHGKVVDEMLSGIPQPPGLDRAALRSGDAVRDRYQLGAQVTGAVACGWIREWV